MDEAQARLLDAFLHGFLVPDLKYIVGFLASQIPMKRISKSARKSVMINMLVSEVQRLVALDQCDILDHLVNVMNQRKFVPIYERVDKHINLRSRLPSQGLTNMRSGQAAVPTTTGLAFQQMKMEYKPSPFYTIHTRLVPAKVFPTNVNTRCNKLFAFELTAEQLQLFTERCPDDGRSLYEIRFFCTHYDMQHVARCLNEVEFPPICEIKINSNHTINGSVLRGMKNKPGTTNPADLTFACSLTSRRNAVEFVYANTTKPYAGSIELVKRIPLSDIIKKMKETNVISKEKTLKRLQELEDDNDIVLESETISTKCPLGFTRIQTPSRSIHCHHLQCFDATTFLMMNQQTPTWCCPICNRKMESCDEVGLDEYFEDILSQVSENVESIRIEEGGKFKILDEQDDITDNDNDDDESTPVKQETMISEGDENDRVTDSVTILDDDSELEEQQDPDDIPLAKRQKTAASTTVPPSSTTPSTRQPVIDLTLDSEDEAVEHETSPSYTDTDDNTSTQISPYPPTTRSPSSTSTTTASSITSFSLASAIHPTGTWAYKQPAPIPTSPKEVIRLPWPTNNGDRPPTDSTNSPSNLPSLALPPLSPAT